MTRRQPVRSTTRRWRYGRGRIDAGQTPDNRGSEELAQGAAERAHRNLRLGMQGAGNDRAANRGARGAAQEEPSRAEPGTELGMGAGMQGISQLAVTMTERRGKKTQALKT
jgi:hypothetical protein